MRKLLLLCTALLLAACGGGGEEPDPVIFPDLPAEGTVTIMGGNNYGINDNRASYYTGYYPFMKQDCLVFHIELTGDGGITVEIAEELIGKTIYFGCEPWRSRPEQFWFLAIGNGHGTFRTFDNDDASYGGHRGWFAASVDEGGVCTLQFSILQGGTLFASGNLSGEFKKLTKL